METVDVILLALAAVSFLIAAIGVSVQRVSPIALGLLFWVMVPLINAVDVLGK